MAGVTLRTLRHFGIRWLTSRECLLAFFLYVVGFTYAQRVEFVETNALSNPSITLQRMILDKSQGKIYVGSVNTIYKLSENLDVLSEERTGPVQDHPSCFPPPGPCQDVQRQLMDNINKVLAIDGDKLITCGSVYQGTCQLRSLGNFAMLGNNTQEEVAPNTVHGTSVGFVADGPQGNVLYVASSHAPWLDSNVPTISSRRISINAEKPKDLFKVLQQDYFSTPAKIVIPPEILTTGSGKFNISYVYGFSNGNFSYFVGIQPEDEELPQSPYKTKLARVCHRDASYYSYIELPLTCVKDGVNYNLAQSAYKTTLGGDLESTDFKKGDSLLIVTFSKSDRKSLEPLEESAVCIYSMKSIDYQFWMRRKACAAAETPSFDIKWQGTLNRECTNAQSLLQIIEAAGPQYCHTENFMFPLGGSTPIERTAIYTNMSLLTAMAATPHLSETVIFAGDNLGNVKKLRILDSNTAKFVEEEAVSDEPILQNGLMFNKDKNFLYAMTSTKITKLPVEQCDKHKTCDECLGVGNGVGDPYCGWCTLKNSCTRRTDAECPGSVDTTQANRWLGKNDQCIRVMEVTPESTSKDKREWLTLNVSSLPTVTGSESYNCMYTNPRDDSLIKVEDATVDDGGSLVTCRTPPVSDLPTSVPGFLRVTLSIATENREKIVSTNFDFYECNKFDNCIDCVNNAYKCDWCIYNNTCTGSASVCGDSSGIVGSKEPKQPALTDRLGPDFCPQVVVGAEILIPAGVSRSFNVSAKNLPNPPKGSSTSFVCLLNYENQEARVPATRVSDREVQCQESRYNYNAETNNLAVSLTIEWGSNNAKIDNPHNVVVNLYKCQVNRDNCGECLAANPKYKCGWCESRSSSQKRLIARKTQCKIEPQCSGSGEQWLNGSTLCPNPTIESFEPRAGHIEGGTNLTIQGVNLGQRASDIKSIRVAGLQCEQIVELYVTASQVVCETSGTATKKAGIIEIEIGDSNLYNRYQARSSDKFEYVIPVVTSISPKEGPASGGTKITIKGENLNAGSSISATVAGKPCRIDSITQFEAVCTTSPATAGDNGSFSINFDNGIVQAPKRIEYLYSPNPTITGFDRSKSIASGGLIVEVDGTGLDLVQFPKMVFTVDKEKYKSSCEVIKPALMRCATPDVSGSPRKPPYEIKKGDFGFELDGLTNYTSMSDVTEIQSFEIHPDPFYHSFDTDNHVLLLNIDQQKYLYLEIEGQNLTLASNEKDVEVRVGIEKCNNILLNRERLTCDAPKQKPESRPGDPGPNPIVVVTHGNLNFTVGYVQYKGDAIDQVLVIGATAGAILAILIILLITLIYYRKATENERLVKQMEQQRDALELRVAQECKEAFAELQTDMTTLTSNLGGSGIPYLDYRFYAIRTLFPDQPSHSVLKELSKPGKINEVGNGVSNGQGHRPHHGSIHDARRHVEFARGNQKIPTASRAHIEKGLTAFGHLIDNKTFLLCFIHTLEEQKGFSLKDMSNVASLIMVVLQGKMEYATEVLKVLLADLIERHVEKDRARLLMRRNESVAEKMVSNWLSFLLYNFIRENAGEPLFMLYYAIKQQVEKGPVDAITGEARYGLSEVKVIRQQIDYNFLTIYAIGLDRDADPFQVRVLDCDTISQVKEKILDVVYKTIPYSHRPPKEELDLEWRCGLQGKMILQDDDGSKVPEGEWKKMNTLATYEIRNGATIALVPKQGFTMSAFSTSSTRYMNVSATSSPCRSTTPMLNSESDNGVKQWHLVKPSDTDHKGDGERDHKMMAEIYLPRLLTTKGTLQKFVDDLFETIFSVNMRGNTLPLAIKYLFDFLDDQARLHEITNPDIVHSWKSNSLPLRFWVNLIKNPDLIFDTYKSETVDACLSIIGQTLMDACSVSEHQLTKDSPSSKLLYAKDIPTYKEWVSRYYKDIQALPGISDQDMAAMLAEHSHNHQYDFHTMTALNELYFYYACTYKTEILKALTEDEFAQKHRLAERFSDISRLIAESM